MPKNIYSSFYFFASFCGISFLSFGQLAPTFEGVSTPKFSHQFTFQQDPSYYFIDTSFNSLHWYHQFNHSNSDLFGYRQLSNDGSALLPLIGHTLFSPDIWETYTAGPYSRYFNSHPQIPYYQVRSPLTEANYWMGFERGQSFNFYHTQNITPKWNGFLNFRRLNSNGLYANNRNEMTSFLFSTRYGTNKDIYNMYAYLDFENLEVSENGGIDDVAQFLQEPPSNKALVPMNLDQDARRLKKSEIMLDQSLDILKAFKSFRTFNNPDSLAAVNDSIAASKPDNTLKFGHQFKYTRRASVYQSHNSEFYPNYYRALPGPSNPVKDSVIHYQMDNFTYIETSVGDSSKFDLKAGIRQLSTVYSGYGFQLKTNNLGLSGTIGGKLSDRLFLNGALDFIFAGPLRENLRIKGQARLKFFSSIYGFGEYELNQQYPDFYDQIYFGNNYAWASPLRQQLENNLTAGLAWGKGNKLTYTVRNYQNYTYYSTEGIPAQSVDEGVTVNEIRLRQNFTFWNFLHQDNDVIYQLVGGNERVLPLPDLVTRNSIYFEFPLFNNALKCLLGTELNYFSKFYAKEYNSAIGRFQLQNTRQTGGYPLLDVFANFDLAKARIFVRYGHINQGFSGNNYLLTPSYAMPDRVIRLGITWRFFN